MPMPWSEMLRMVLLGLGSRVLLCWAPPPSVPSDEIMENLGFPYKITYQTKQTGEREMP